jgi:hypothetical protein
MATTNPSVETTANGGRARGDTAVDGVTGTARQMADTVAGAAGEVAARVPDVAQGTRDAFSEANRMVQGGSDQTLKLVGASAIGFAVGLLVGGASRFLVILALVPAALIGATLLERIEGGARPATKPGGLQGR